MELPPDSAECPPRPLPSKDEAFDMSSVGWVREGWGLLALALLYLASLWPRFGLGWPRMASDDPVLASIFFLGARRFYPLLFSRPLVHGPTII